MKDEDLTKDDLTTKESTDKLTEEEKRVIRKAKRFFGTGATIMTIALTIITICLIINAVKYINEYNNQQTMTYNSESKTSKEVKDMEDAVSVVNKNNNLIENINKLSFEIHNNTVKNNENENVNVIQSPYSITLVLSMLDMIADGNTKEELENTLGINDLDSWNNQVKALLENETGIVKEDTDKEQDIYSELNENVLSLLTSNSIWVDNKLSLSENFVENVELPLKEYYNGDLYIVDFNDKETSKEVDKWISDKTNGLIKELGADVSNYKSLLINTVYFKGTWVNQFNKEHTEKKIFRNGLEEKEVDTMHLYSKDFKYLKDGQLEMISLPYYNNFEMLIVKTTKDKDLTTSEFDNLTNNEKIELLNEFDSKAENIKFKTVQIPKFKVEYDNDNIKKEIEQLGIKATFNSDEANLSKLSSELYVDDIKHKTVITVDENGTEAASITALMLRNMAFIEKEETKQEFIADKPFTYIIRNKENGLIYFIGNLNSIN